MRRFLVTLVLGLGMGSRGLVGPDLAAAQVDQETEYEIRPYTAICPRDFPGGDATFSMYCTFWEVTVTMVAEDGTLLASCMTPCAIAVPRGSTTILSIDPADIPAGYVLVSPGSTVQEFYAYDWPPIAPEYPPFFVLNPLEDGGDGAPILETPADESVGDDTAESDGASEAVAAETTDAQGVDDVISLPTTGTQPEATGARGMTNLLIAVASLMLAGACGLRRCPTHAPRQ
jgi:hypothetical protein